MTRATPPSSVLPVLAAGPTDANGTAVYDEALAERRAEGRHKDKPGPDRRVNRRVDLSVLKPVSAGQPIEKPDTGRLDSGRPGGVLKPDAGATDGSGGMIRW